MKKITLLFTLLISIFLFSQNEGFFVGKDAHLLIGKKVKVKEGSYSLSNFYKNSNLTKIVFKKGFYTDYNKIKDLEFIVKSVGENPSSYSDDIVLILNNSLTKDIYYKYNPELPSLFKLSILDEINLPKNYYCDKTEIKVDKFSSEKQTTTPYEFEYRLSKYEKDNDVDIYLTLRTYGISLKSGKKGAIILFDDGTKLEKPNAKVSVESSEGKGWDYSIFIKLDQTDINTLKNKTITDYRLYIFDREMDKTNAFNLKEYLKCFIKK